MCERSAWEESRHTVWEQWLQRDDNHERFGLVDAKAGEESVEPTAGKGAGCDAERVDDFVVDWAGLFGREVVEAEGAGVVQTAGRWMGAE